MSFVFSESGLNAVEDARSSREAQAWSFHRCLRSGRLGLRQPAPSGFRSETSSLRWRSERPPIVLLGAIRHWARALLAFTLPYLGTASSMSNTFAVSTYSGGLSRSEWIVRLGGLQDVPTGAAHLASIFRAR